VTGLTVHTVYTASLQAALRARAVAAMEIFRAAIALPAGVLGIAVINPPYVGAVLGTGAAYVLSAAWARTLAVRSLRGLKKNKETFTVVESVRQLLWFGWPISLWYGVSFSFPFAERTLIQRYLGAATAGQYAAVYDVIYRGCGFLLLPIVLAVHPRIMKAHSLGRADESRRLWGAGLTLQLIVSCVVTAAVVVAGPWIIRLTGLRSTDTAMTLVYPLAAAGCVWQISLIAHKQLEARRQTRSMLAFLMVALVVNVVINMATLPRFGAVAAAYTLLLTGALYVVCVVLAGFTPQSAQMNYARGGP
jgi:O-antigen/teichoic acid export membrane protein